MRSDGKRTGRAWHRLAEAVPTFTTPDGGHVVVASEDAARRAAIAAALTRDGHRVSEARAPLELFKLVGVAGPSLRHPTRADVVVLDVTGETWATLEMLEAVCSEHWTLRVIALAHPGDATARAEAARLGAAAVLELPVDEGMVRAEVLTAVQPPRISRGAA